MTFVGLPPVYDGTTELHGWFQLFDRWARAHYMDDETQGRKMPALLDGEALIVYLMLPEERHTLKGLKGKRKKKEELESAFATPVSWKYYGAVCSTSSHCVTSDTTTARMTAESSGKSVETATTASK